MTETVKELEKELEQIDKRRKDILDAINSLQRVCTHINKEGKSTYVYDSHDSHKTYYKCTKCGKEK